MSSDHPYLPSLGELKWCLLQYLVTSVVIPPLLALPSGAEVVCFTLLGEFGVELALGLELES